MDLMIKKNILAFSRYLWTIRFKNLKLAHTSQIGECIHGSIEDSTCMAVVSTGFKWNEWQILMNNNNNHHNNNI